MSTTARIEVYSNGIVYCSVCADGNMPVAEVVEEVNRINPACTQNGWVHSSEPTFKSGNPNPCPCDEDPSRKHYLMEC